MIFFGGGGSGDFLLTFYCYIFYPLYSAKIKQREREPHLKSSFQGKKRQVFLECFQQSFLRSSSKAREPWQSNPGEGVYTQGPNKDFKLSR